MSWRCENVSQSFLWLLQNVLLLVVDLFHYVSYGWVLLCEILFENGMDCIVVHAVNLPPYQSVDWNYVSLISDKQWVTSFSCSVVVWEHCCPMNDVSIVMSPVNMRLLRIKYSTNMHQNSSFLDYMNVELIFGSILPPADTTRIWWWYFLTST